MNGLDAATRAIGALLSSTSDVPAASRALHLYLLEPTDLHRDAVEARGMSASTVEEFRPILPSDFIGLAELCKRGSVWALAHTDSPATSSWEPVITGQTADPAAFPRRTAETLVALAIDAMKTIELFAPFTDVRGIRAIGRALAGATARGVQVTFAHRKRDEDAAAALADLVRDHGVYDNLNMVLIGPHGTYPHLKLMIVDRRRAYLGSANLTYAALVSNLEVGALVAGEGVSALSRMFDVLLTEGVADTERPM